MSEIQPGNRIRHRLTNTEYYYVGPYPRRELEVLATVNDPEGKTYTVERGPFHKYYEIVPDEIVKGATYRNTTSLSTMYVESVSKCPDMPYATVFGFLTRYQGSGHAYPVFYNESTFRDVWERVEDDA